MLDSLLKQKIKTKIIHKLGGKRKKKTSITLLPSSHRKTSSVSYFFLIRNKRNVNCDKRGERNAKRMPKMLKK